jgi:hypothetical protein
LNVHEKNLGQRLLSVPFIGAIQFGNGAFIGYMAGVNSVAMGILVTLPATLALTAGLVTQYFVDKDVVPFWTPYAAAGITLILATIAALVVGVAMGYLGVGTGLLLGGGILLGLSLTAGAIMMALDPEAAKLAASQ